VKFLSKACAVAAVTVIGTVFYIGILPIVLIILADSIWEKDGFNWTDKDFETMKNSNDKQH
jgi:hypothetical protein